MKSIFLALAFASIAGSALADEVRAISRAGSTVISYNTPTDANQVAATLNAVVKEDVATSLNFA